MTVRQITLMAALMLAAVLACRQASAQSGPKPLGHPGKLDASITNAVFKATGPDTYQLGQVVLNRAQKTLSFPAEVNLRNGPVEYLLVGHQGKIHESVLRTEVEPYHVHVGMLLLNAKGAPPGGLIEDYRKPVPGDPIAITVMWEEPDRQREVSGEDLVWDRNRQAAMTKGEWTYSGSRIFDGMFLAQRDRSFVAVIGDIDALVNNPRARRDNDQNWMANTNTCPALETKVTVTFKLLPAQKP